MADWVCIGGVDTARGVAGLVSCDTGGENYVWMEVRGVRGVCFGLPRLFFLPFLISVGFALVSVALLSFTFSSSTLEVRPLEQGLQN